MHEIINKPIMFWTSFFQTLIDKRIIRSIDPKRLAEDYYNYGMFKMFEAIILKYPEDPKEINMDEIFDNIENHFNFILGAVAIDKESIKPLSTITIDKKLIKFSSYKRKINKTIMDTVAIDKRDMKELDDENNNL